MRFKKLISMALAATLALSFGAVTVLADDDYDGADKTVIGEGYIGWGDEKDGRTISPTFAPVTAGYDDPNDPIPADTHVGGTNAISSATQQNIPGATIVVTWPNSATSTTLVDSQGEWIIAIPADIELEPGDVLKATQKELDKYTSFPVYVEVDGDTWIDPVDPPIEPPIEPKNPEDYLTMTIPNSFYWWVTQDTYPDVASSDHFIITEGITLTDKETGEEKSYDPTVAVSFKSFNQMNLLAADVAADLELYFTDDFAVVTENLASGFVADEKVLIGEIQSDLNEAGHGANDTLQFGFEGVYKEALPSQGKVPTYNMVINLKITEDDGWFDQYKPENP